MAQGAAEIILQHLEIRAGAAGARDDHNIKPLQDTAGLRMRARKPAHDFAQTALATVAHDGVTDLSACRQTVAQWRLYPVIRAPPLTFSQGNGTIGCARGRIICCACKRIIRCACKHDKTRARPTPCVAGHFLKISAVGQFLYRLGHQQQRQVLRPVALSCSMPVLRPSGANQADRTLRPLARRADRILRPATVAMRARKPWRRLRTSLLGWYVRFTGRLRVSVIE